MRIKFFMYQCAMKVRALPDIGRAQRNKLRDSKQNRYSVTALALTWVFGALIS